MPAIQSRQDMRTGRRADATSRSTACIATQKATGATAGQRFRRGRGALAGIATAAGRRQGAIVVRLATAAVIHNAPVRRRLRMHWLLVSIHAGRHRRRGCIVLLPTATVQAAIARSAAGALAQKLSACVQLAQLTGHHVAVSSIIRLLFR